jgi:hypothetical protein
MVCTILVKIGKSDLLKGNLLIGFWTRSNFSRKEGVLFLSELFTEISLLCYFMIVYFSHFLPKIFGNS